MADCYIEKILLESLQVTNGTSFAEFKSEVIKQNAVPISVLGLIFLLGLPANAVMLHVFRTAFKKSAYKLFSIWLACLGLVIVIIAVPITFWLFLWEMNNPSEIQCKVGVFFFSFLIASCHVILFIIAIERYRKVFYSLHWQVREKEINFYNVIALLVGALVIAPHAIFVGQRDVPLGLKDINATVCLIADSHRHSPWPATYYMILNLISFLVTVSIILMYGRIIYTIRRYKKKAQRNEIFPEYDRNDPPCFSSTTRILETRRSTLTLFASTLSFILTTFPFSITAMLLLSNKELLCFIDKKISIVVRTLACTLLLNSVINPCIYLFADVHYRSEVKQLWYRIKSANPRRRL